MPRVRMEIEIDLDIETAARWFAGLDDDQMCKFLVAVAKETESYPCSPENQWYYLGGHLRNCECSTDGARDMVRKWAYWLEHSDHH